MSSSPNAPLAVLCLAKYFKQLELYEIHETIVVVAKPESGFEQTVGDCDIIMCDMCINSSTATGGYPV